MGSTSISTDLDLWVGGKVGPAPAREAVSRPFRTADDRAATCRSAYAFAGSRKAITDSLCNGCVSNSPVNGVRCRVAQVCVENAAISTAAKMFRQRINAGFRIAALSLLGWRIDP